jgi:hypothetical protein
MTAARAIHVLKRYYSAKEATLHKLLEKHEISERAPFLTW